MDRVFCDGYISGLRSMAIMTWLLLSSLDRRNAYSRLFGPLQQKRSMDVVSHLLETVLVLLFECPSAR